jgi:hypothetical protein
MDPEGAGWDVDSYLLANVADLLAAGNWQRGNAGAKTPSEKPRPMYRPADPAAPRVRKSLDQRVLEWKARHCGHEGSDT